MLPPGKARLMRVEHEYDRGGALAYLAAYDVHRARLFGRTEPTTGSSRSDGCSNRSWPLDFTVLGLGGPARAVGPGGTGFSKTRQATGPTFLFCHRSAA
jgi:hypothetical protein